MFRNTEFLDMDDFNPNLMEDLQSVGIIPKKNKSLNENENLSRYAKLHNPFDNMADEEEDPSDEHEEMPSDEESESAPEDQEGMEDQDAQDSKEDSSDEHEEMSDEDPSTSENPDGDEDEQEKQLALAHGMSGGAGKIMPLSPLRMGESKSIRKANALLNEVKELVSKTNTSQRRDATQSFALIASLAEYTSRAFINLSKNLNEDSLRGVAKTYRILAADAGKMAIALGEGKTIQNLDETFKNQLGLLLQGVDLSEDIVEACSDMEDDDNVHNHKDDDNKVHIDIGSHDNDEEQEEEEDKEEKEENLY